MIRSAADRGTWFLRGSAVVGAVLWLAVVCLVLPDGFGQLWGHAILMFAALVMVPVGFAALKRELDWLNTSRLATWAVCLQPIAACCLIWSLLQPQSLFAAAGAMPWVAVCGLVALTGLARGWACQFRMPGDVGICGSLIFMIIGGGWTLFDRAGIRPLNFEPVIVILTAIHFHFAGFALPLLVGLASRQWPSRLLRIIEWTVVVAVPGVAVGITATQLRGHPLIETVAAEWMALAGLGTALTYLWLALRVTQVTLQRMCWIGMSGLLGFGMVLASLYGARSYLPLEWMDIPWMRAWHGTANMLACLIGLLGWCSGARGTSSAADGVHRHHA